MALVIDITSDSDEEQTNQPESLNRQTPPRESNILARLTRGSLAQNSDDDHTSSRSSSSPARNLRHFLGRETSEDFERRRDSATQRIVNDLPDDDDEYQSAEDDLRSGLGISSSRRRRRRQRLATVARESTQQPRSDERPDEFPRPSNRFPNSSSSFAKAGMNGSNLQTPEGIRRPTSGAPRALGAAISFPPTPTPSHTKKRKLNGKEDHSLLTRLQRTPKPGTLSRLAALTSKPELSQLTQPSSTEPTISSPLTPTPAQRTQPLSASQPTPNSRRAPSAARPIPTSQETARPVGLFGANARSQFSGAKAKPISLPPSDNEQMKAALLETQSILSKFEKDMIPMVTHLAKRVHQLEKNEAEHQEKIKGLEEMVQYLQTEVDSMDKHIQGTFKSFADQTSLKIEELRCQQIERDEGPSVKEEA